MIRGMVASEIRALDVKSGAGQYFTPRPLIRAMETEREEMSYLREDFWATTSNKQLNFLQHVRSLLHARPVV